MKILLTGFEPFGGSELNPSAMVVEALASDPPADVDLVTVVLEVVGEEAGDRVVELVATERPDAVVMLGEATGRAGVTIEQVAINLRDYGMDDNAGHRVSNEPVVRDGPDAYFTTLPVEELVQAVRAIGVPAARSLSAGAFLCNEISYRVLHAEAIAKRRTPAGFVHLPRVPEQCLDTDAPHASMGIDRQIDAVRAILEALAG
ncbi:MAG: pyroglutamyl-peptidase I [Phycisphaeraceae bacterium]|nr:pyroglutamyl-peptidase I [Phycisphaeraceae bacterium]